MATHLQHMPAGNTDGPDDGPVPVSPTDYVTIAGTDDIVRTGPLSSGAISGYENVVVFGTGVTSAASIFLGDGNNIVVLGGTGGNNVNLGNGNNAINATGNGSVYTVGEGLNAITLRGNANTIDVIAPVAPPVEGVESIQLGAGQNDVVNLEQAGGSVTGTAITGTTHVTQSGPKNVIVNLNGGTGAITLGDGNDIVTANGNGTTILIGNGNNTITANGNGDFIHAGNGNNTITAGGTSDTIYAGNGNNTITANGNGDAITVLNGNNTITANGTGDTIAAGWGNNNITANGNNDTITVGSTTHVNGNLTLSATGSGDKITVNASPTSVDTITLGSNDTLHITSGKDNITANGAGDDIFGNALVPGSAINALANNTMVFLGSNSSASVHLNPVGTAEAITVQALTTADTYTGTVLISGFGIHDTLDLQGLGFTGFTSGAHSVLANMTFGPLVDTLALGGGGSVKFVQPTAFSASEFAFSSSYGPV